jgi:hypothetical protein
MSAETPRPIRTILVLWLCWALLVILFQKAAAARVELKAPDEVLVWTGAETMPGAHAGRPYLTEPFLNQQVAYDSEYYLSIAIVGYDDPSLNAVWADPQNPELIWSTYPQAFGVPADLPGGHPAGIPQNYQAYSLNYAFFPFYPLMIRVFAVPLRLLGLNPIATATLAGVVVSLLGALGAMLALYDLTRDALKSRGAVRTAFYLIAFPTGFFLAMVHTEGLFAGLAFGSLAMIRRRRWLFAALLAAGATLTRAVGGALVLPLAVAWLREAAPFWQSRLTGKTLPTAAGTKRFWELFGKGVLVLSPLAAFGLWYLALGNSFRVVEAAFFGRGALAVERSWNGWREAFLSLFGPGDQQTALRIGYGLIVFAALLSLRALLHGGRGRAVSGILGAAADLLLIVFGAVIAYAWWSRTTLPQRTFYYLVEFGATILALAACAYVLRGNPELALFSLMVVVISFFSGGTQGMQRYILGAPAVFVMLGRLGDRDEAFDRAWTIGSLLLMGLFAALFASNFWVG